MERLRGIWGSYWHLRVRWRVSIAVAAVLVILVVIGAAAGGDDEAGDLASDSRPSPAATADRTATPTPTPSLAATPEPTQAPTATATLTPTMTPAPTTTPTQGRDTFGEGTFIVGTEIEPGRYRGGPFGSFCSWERLSGFGGAFDEILAIELPPGQVTVVDILPDDAGFTSDGCGSWTTDLSPVTTSPDSDFGDGTYIVSVDVSAGRWRAATLGSLCSWTRLGGFSGDFDDVLGIELPQGASAVVDVLESDTGFQTDGCGPWSMNLSPVTVSPTAAFGDGTYIVGIDIAPGTWRSGGGEDFCSWTRLAGFSGSFGEVIAIELPTGPAIVTIAAADVGFSTSGCGEWSLVR